MTIDDLVKSLKRRISVIPAKAGIQLFQILKNSLDSGFHRSDDFLREHHDCLRNRRAIPSGKADCRVVAWLKIEPRDIFSPGKLPDWATPEAFFVNGQSRN
jgi:hypothetical protein